MRILFNQERENILKFYLDQFKKKNIFLKQIYEYLIFIKKFKILICNFLVKVAII